MIFVAIILTELNLGSTSAPWCQLIASTTPDTGHSITSDTGVDGSSTISTHSFVESLGHRAPRAVEFTIFHLVVSRWHGTFRDNGHTTALMHEVA